MVSVGKFCMTNHLNENKMFKVAVVSIMKNEEQFIERWAESCKDADYRILLDTRFV